MTGIAPFPRQHLRRKELGVAGGLQRWRGASGGGDSDGEPRRPDNGILADIVGVRQRIALMHVDIQGGEADLVSSAIALLCEKVAS